MTVVYGNLPKSQTDAETIEEMIDRKIAEHESAPTSHMGAGESIDVHRKTEIVDHLAGSVLNDKFTMTEYSFSTQFFNLDGWDTLSDPSVEQNALKLYIEEGYGPITAASYPLYRPQPYMTLEKDFMMQFLAQTDHSNTSNKIFMGYNQDNPGTLYDFIGFERIAGVTKCNVQFYPTDHKSSAISVDMDLPHVYRIQNNAGEKTIYFYIDGQIVHTHTYTTENINGDGNLYFHNEVVGSNDGYLYIMDLFVSRGV